MYKVFDIHTHTYPEAISEKAVTSLGNFYNFLDSFICKGGKCIRWSLRL